MTPTLPTVIPGLHYRGAYRELIHTPSGEVLLTLGVGRETLSRDELTGLARVRWFSGFKCPFVLASLLPFDWSGDLSDEHRAAAEALGRQLQTPETALAVQDRARRIYEGLTIVSDTLGYGPRAQLLGKANRTLDIARRLRAKAVTPAEKAAATRMEKQLQAELEAGGLHSAAQMDAIMKEDTQVRRYFAGIARTVKRHQQLSDAEDNRKERITEQRDEWLETSDAPVLQELKTCLLILDKGNLTASVRNRPRPPLDEHGNRLKIRLPNDLHAANRLRLQRKAAGESLDPADPSVRALTRESRLQRGQCRLIIGGSGGQYTQALLRQLYNFRQAAEYKTKAVRKKRYAEAYAALHNFFSTRRDFSVVPEAVRDTRARAALRRVDHMLNSPCYPHYDVRELPVPPLPRFTAAHTVTVPQTTGTHHPQQPSLF